MLTIESNHANRKRGGKSDKEGKKVCNTAESCKKWKRPMRRYKLGKSDWTGKKCKQEVRYGKVDQIKVAVSTKVRRTENCKDDKERTKGRTEDDNAINDKQDEKLGKGNCKWKFRYRDRLKFQIAFTGID